MRLIILLSLLISLPAVAGWQATWIESFSGTGVNWNNWTAQTQANYNNEVQCYTDDDSSALRNYDVSDGTLKIIARKGTIACPGLNGTTKSWTSGRLNSKDKAEFLYGRIETRIKFNDLRHGTWPAFWALENRIAEQPIKGDNDSIWWPNPGAGEIDIWEWHANSGNNYITAFHNASGCGSVDYYNYPGGAVDVQDFHRYAMEWTPDTISFHVDDILVRSVDISTCAQYKEPMFLLLNVAMGGTLGGAIDPTLTTATMEVDYVARCVASESSTYMRCDESTPMALDDDQDGVINDADQCPNTSTGTAVNVNGCPILTAPNTPAPTPEVPAANVISLFSDHYENIEGVDLNPNWNQSTVVSEVVIEGNNTLKYSNFNYQGTAFEDNHQDVSDFTTLHLDYWTADASQFQVFLISPGPLENPVNVPITLQSWQHVAIPLSQFTAANHSDIFQLKMTGNGTFFLDNIYFSKAATTDSTDESTDSTDESTDSSTDNTTNTNTQVITQTGNGNSASGGSSDRLWLFTLLLVLTQRFYFNINRDFGYCSTIQSMRIECHGVR